METFMNIKKVVFLSAAIAFIFSACTKKESGQKTEAKNPQSVSAEETWTKDDLEKYLASAEHWEIDGSGTVDIYSIHELHDFFSGNENKGFFSSGTWNVIAPNAVEIIFNTGRIEKIIYTEITANSFKWNGHTAKAVNQNLDEATKRHIPLFSKLDPSTITESGSITETYHIYESPKEMKVKTDDGSSLNYRAQPVTGEKLGKFSYGDTVYVSQRTHDASTIDGITDYWYYALSYADIEPYGGWVFGGYLSEPEESSTSSDLFGELLGEWDSASYMLKLKGNGDFALGRKESEWIGGNWTLENKTIKVTNAQVYDEEPESFEMKVISVSENELTLSLGDSTLDFTRIFEE